MGSAFASRMMKVGSLNMKYSYLAIILTIKILNVFCYKYVEHVKFYGENLKQGILKLYCNTNMRVLTFPKIRVSHLQYTESHVVSLSVILNTNYDELLQNTVFIGP